MVRSTLAFILCAAAPVTLACNLNGDAASESSTATMCSSSTATSTAATGTVTTNSSSSSSSSSSTATTTTSSTGSSGSTSPETGTGTSTSTGTGSTSGTTGDLGPMVDQSDPQLYSFEFTADQADPEASEVLAPQLAYLDTQVTPVGKLVVYLHGAGAPMICGSKAHGQLLAGMGLHVFSPCYRSDYGVGNCGDDIGGCRLEAFEGKDHHDFIDISLANSAEQRIVKGLQYLQ